MVSTFSSFNKVCTGPRTELMLGPSSFAGPLARVRLRRFMIGRKPLPFGNSRSWLNERRLESKILNASSNLTSSNMIPFNLATAGSATHFQAS